MAEFDLCLRGRLVLPDQIIEDGHVGVRDGAIALVGEGAMPAARARHDLRGLWITPGAIDGQTHACNQRDHEGIGRASRAAAAGGVTSFVDMPYDEPAPITDAARFSAKAAVVAADAHVDVGLYATIAPAERLTHLDCWRRFGSARLSHHIYMLRGIGWPVQMIEETVTTSDAGRPASISPCAEPFEPRGYIGCAASPASVIRPQLQ